MPVAAITGAISAAGTVAAGRVGMSGARRAAAAQVKADQGAIQNTDQAKNEAVNRASDIYRTARGTYQPYVDAGASSLKQLTAGLAPGGEFTKTLDASNFKDLDPGYDFRMQQGQQVLQRAAAATGSLGSGGTLKALARYGQDYASGEFNNAYNRFLTTRQANYSNLSNIAGLGLNAGNSLTSAGTNYANLGANVDMGAARDTGGYLIHQGDAQAGGILGESNSLAGMIKGVANTAMSLPWSKLFGGDDSGGDTSPVLPGNYAISQPTYYGRAGQPTLPNLNFNTSSYTGMLPGLE